MHLTDEINIKITEDPEQQGIKELNFYDIQYQIETQLNNHKKYFSSNNMVKAKESSASKKDDVIKNVDGSPAKDTGENKDSNRQNSTVSVKEDLIEAF